MVAELSERLSHAVGGAGGEKSAWGEPLFYMAALFIRSFFLWNGGLLGAIVGVASGRVVSCVWREPLRIALAVAAISALVIGVLVFVQHGPHGFRVVEVASRIEPSDYVGPCPVTVKFIGTIRVAGGAGEVNYQISRPSMSGPYTKFAFDTSGSREVSHAWAVGEGNKTYQISETWGIRVEESERMSQLNSSGRVTIRCTAPVPSSAAASPVSVSASGMELETDRPGADYSSFDLKEDRPGLCGNACLADPKCKAWTYVAPDTVQGSRPRCWLKHSVPVSKPGACCISGTILGR
jgi:hypothetical protein